MLSLVIISFSLFINFEAMVRAASSDILYIQMDDNGRVFYLISLSAIETNLNGIIKFRINLEFLKNTLILRPVI